MTQLHSFISAQLAAERRIHLQRMQATPPAETPQIAVSRDDSAQMVHAPTGGHARSLRRRLAQLLRTLP